MILQALQQKRQKTMDKNNEISHFALPFSSQPKLRKLHIKTFEISSWVLREGKVDLEALDL